MSRSSNELKVGEILIRAHDGKEFRIHSKVMASYLQIVSTDGTKQLENAYIKRFDNLDVDGYVRDTDHELYYLREDET